MEKQGRNPIIHNYVHVLFLTNNILISSISTFFGEWPFACFLYEPSNDAKKHGIGNFIGGATLLAPGVVITGASKVE